MTHARWRWGLLLATAVMLPVHAQQEPVGAPQPDRTLRDPEFGVVARHLGLERRVDMLQWQQEGGRYVRTWSPVVIDSASFPPAYRNPGALPLAGRRWVAASITIDGAPVDPEVLRTLGEWRDFRPSFSALPGNLAATFQPEGIGLGSADNPLQPRIGDLRIHWRDLVLPPLDGLIVLRDGRWQLVPPAAPAVDAPAITETKEASSLPWWWGGALVLLVIAFAAYRRRQR
jgi:hypothetical protein